ncbi:hypothetical protein [Agrobacterium tumefaciens]
MQDDDERVPDGEAAATFAEAITLLKSARNLWVGATHRLADKA